jgi:hypothetical protein
MNSNLISKNISVYFDDLINKPIITLAPKQSTMSSFYKNYVEHNLLLIFIIIFIILFLLFKYYNKNSNDIETKNNETKNNEIKEKKINEKEKKINEKENKLLQKINKERELLKKEKSEILSIIDELSEMNYKKDIPQYIQADIKEENIKPQKKEYNKRSNNIDLEAYTNINESFSNDYYDINENKSELIDGVYFETPYN